MADPAKITSVKLQLPDEAATLLGIDDTAIAIWLDSGQTVTHAILSAFRAIAAKTSMMTDISESGSTRNMSILNSNARQMITYWQTMADREDAESDITITPRFRSHRATRV